MAIRRAASTACLLAFAAAAACLAGGWSDAPEREVTLPSGRKLAYAYHFNRNDVRHSWRVGDSIVALTGSGNLLRFEMPGYKLTHQGIGSPKAVCLGRGVGDEVLAGFADGAVYRLDPSTLARTKVGQLPAAPVWVGAYSTGGKKGVLAITGKPGAILPYTLDPAKPRGEPPCVVHDQLAGKTYPLPLGAEAGLVDSKLRLWVGLDYGEFGGWCGCLDLPTGQLRVVHRGNTKGFLELPDGQVWSYVGGGHMGGYTSSIRRIDVEPAARVYFSKCFAMTPEGYEDLAKLAAKQPIGGIRRIIYEPSTKSVVVDNYRNIFERDLYRGDLALAKWEKLAQLPDWAVGRIGPRPKLPDQLGTENVSRILPTTEGMLLVPAYFRAYENGLWRRVQGHWQELSLALPEEKGVHPDMLRGNPLTGKDGRLLTVYSGHRQPGALSEDVVWIVEWRHGKPERVLTTEACFADDSVFTTPDGQVWAVGWWSSVRRNTLWHLVGSEWQVVGPAPDAGRCPRVVEAQGPPWLVLAGHSDRGANALLLRPAKGTEPTQLVGVKFAGAETKASQIHDAIAWAPGQFVLATDLGVLLYDAATDSLSKPPFPPPNDKIRSLCRDGLGRVWMAGDGLWVTNAAATAVRDIRAAVPIAPADIGSLAADPDHRDGAILALGRRGVLFLRAEEAPAQ